MPRAFVRDGRTIVMPAGVVFLNNLRAQGGRGVSADFAVPPMHAMIAMRAAASRAAMGLAAGPPVTDSEADPAPTPTPRPASPRPKPVAGPNGFETLPATAPGG